MFILSIISKRSKKSEEADKLGAEVDAQFLPRTPFQPNYALNNKVSLNNPLISQSSAD